MSDKKHSGFEALANETSLYPQEALLKTKKHKASMFIGIPKETSFQENRVALSPEGVILLVNNGHEICVETMAGLESRFSDKEYSDAGAKIVYSKAEVFHADIILKVEPPTIEEISLMKPGRALISALQLGNQNIEYLNAINKKKLTALAYELIEDKAGGMPAVRAMSEIAGSTVMLVAAEYLSNVNDGKGIILGGITGVPPTKVVILGAGTVAEYAARAAIGLGAEIQIFDNHLYKLRRLKHALGHQVYTSIINHVLLTESLRQADVVIGAIRAEKGRTRHVVTEEMVSQMKPDSVIIDVSIDQGGCIETSEMTTHKKPVFKKYGVIHYCVPNIASRAARTASIALNNIFTPIFHQAGEEGGFEEMIYNNSWLMKGVYSFNGNLTNPYIAKTFNMKHKELNLFLAARFRA
jgi:alanine dehydrogenase